MKICFWSTTFQADNQALAHHLVTQPGVQLFVAMHEPERYRRTPAFELFPLDCTLAERDSQETKRALEKFEPDVVVIDNHLPKERVAPRMLVLWHGFGWRYDDLSQMRAELRMHVGDVSRPNTRFTWQAFGEWDKAYRTKHSGFAARNVMALGSAYSDLLRPESALWQRFERERAQPAYRFDVSRRKTVLFAPTWHYGGPLEHWGDEYELLSELCTGVASHDANVLLRLHDRNRYEPQAIARLLKLAAHHDNVQLKFKDEDPDSLVDILISDVMVSNYSSMLNAWYYTSKPSVHIDPRLPDQKGQHFRSFRRGRVRKERQMDPSSMWKLDLDQVGGLRAGSFPELLSQLDRALEEPDCCVAAARDFCTRYITGVDGTTCERITQQLRHMCAEPSEPQPKPWLERMRGSWRRG